MTSEERLAIAEEIALTALHNQGFAGFAAHTLRVKHEGGGWRYRVEPVCGSHCGEWMSDPFVALYEFRQKLAAEREAAMSPNERKYKAALEEIARDCGHRELDVYCLKASNTAREALKEST